jgi:GxxExxY protein
MNTDEHRLNSITEKVIGCAYRVANELGPGFLEKVYENALAHELKKAGVAVEQQRRVMILYDGVVVGDYVADLLVEEVVLVELKAAKALDEVHLAQCLNYLRGASLRIGLLINFGTARIEVKRVVNGY